jgi:zinc protease
LNDASKGDAVARSRLLAAVTVLALSPALALAQGAPAPRASAPAEAVPRMEFEKYTLPNGLQVILHVDRKLPIVHVNQWFHVGSKNEKPGRTGFAHLFEHMMFQGSKNAKDEYFVYVEKAGANLQEGGVNGTTNNDRTNYFATVPSGNLEALLWLESDRLATLLDAVDQAKLDNQRDVVKNERRQGLENQPYGRWYSLLFESLFPAGHPYSWPVIGSQEDLTAASLEDVKEFFRTYYSPNNLSLAIAGDFDPAEAKALVAKYFGGIPAGPALARPSRFLPALTSEKVVEVADRVPQERSYVGWISPAYFASGEAELELASRILTDGLSSRLAKILVYDKQLCTAVNSFQNSQEIASAFIVIATARPGAKLSEIEAIITEEIARLAKSGPTPAELARAKTKQEFEFVSNLERIGGFGGKADILNQYNTFLGDPDKLRDDLGRYRGATVAGVQKQVDQWLNTANRAVIRFRPETSGRSDENALDRTSEPALGADRPFRAPEVGAAKLENGLEVFVVERADLPKVAVAFAARAGSVADPAGKEGVAQLTIANIDMGTRTRQALAIEEALGDLGTSLTGAAYRESSQLSFEVLKRNLTAALAIVADVVRGPTFPAEELERERSRHLDNLAQQAKNPNAVASRVRAMLAFGADHPYGRPAAGLPSTVATITREDLQRFHAERWRPAGSALVFVGAVTLNEAVALARTHFGTWKGEAPAPIEIPAPHPAAPGKLYLVDRQDSAQSVITQFLPAPSRRTDDYYALQLADAVWGGGGFGTRLNLNLREDKGYSYGVFSTLALYQSSGMWFAMGGVQTNKTKESVVEFRKELADVAGARPITQGEFDTAKVRWVRGYAQKFESFSRVAEQVADLWAQERPMTELQAESDQIENTQLQATLLAARKYARPEASALVVVGDRSKIEPGLRELEGAEIVVLDVEGKPVSP